MTITNKKDFKSSNSSTEDIQIDNNTKYKACITTTLTSEFQGISTRYKRNIL